MKSLLYTILSFLSFSAFAGSNIPDVKLRVDQLDRNVYYRLTRERATDFNLDYDQIVTELNVQPHENLLVKRNERNELDLAIFDNEVFSAVRADIVK